MNVIGLLTSYFSFAPFIIFYCNRTWLEIPLLFLKLAINKSVDTIQTGHHHLNSNTYNMAKSSTSPSQEVETLPPKKVQEKEIPQKMIYKGSDAGSLDTCLPLIDIPTIDFVLLTSPESSAQELEKLRSVLSSWGCFQVSSLPLNFFDKILIRTSNTHCLNFFEFQAINHGIEPAFLDKVKAVGRQFFALPAEEKNKYARDIAIGFEGYANHIINGEEQAFDWIDRLYLITGPEDRKQLKFWPENPESFR